MKRFDLSKGLVAVALTSSLVLSGCGAASTSAVDSGGGGNNTVTGANIYGKVDTEVNPQKPLKPMETGYFQKVFGARAPSADCTVTAYDLAGVAKGTAATASDGTYFIAGLVANETYKVVATCGSTKLTVVSKADEKAKTAKTPAVTNPATTMIAAFIMQAVVEAVSGALEALPGGVAQNVKDQIKTQILAALDAVIATVQETIETAMETGAIAVPNASQATTIAETVEDIGDVSSDAAATAADTVNNVVETAVNTVVPPSVEQSVSGAASSASGFAACAKSVTGNTQAGCTRAFAKFMYTTLSFGVALRTDNTGVFYNAGTFDATNGCNKAWADAAGFPNARLTKYVASPNASATDPYETTDMPKNYCIIQPAIQATDRNHSEGGGKDDGEFFVESGELLFDGQTTGQGTTITGLLTAISTAMFEGYKYTLGDLDKAIFGFDAGVAGTADDAGFNMRLVNLRFDATAGRPVPYYYNNSNQTWTALKNTAGTQWVEPWQFKFSSTDPGAWIGGGDSSDNGHGGTSPDNNDTLIPAIGAASQKDWGIFNKKFGGTIPTQQELDEWLDKERVHKDYNPSGQREFMVVYSQATQMAQNGQSNPCWDHDNRTPCVGLDGTEYPAVKVNVTLGDPIGTTKFRPITAITKSDTGAYYLMPIWSGESFSGIFGFRRISDGQELLDDWFRRRTVKIVLAASSECETNGLPAAPGCAAGKVYNVSTEWNCSSNSPCSVSYQALSATAVTGDGLAAGMIQTDMSNRWENYFSGSFQYGHSLVNIGRWEEQSYLKYTVLPADSATDSVTYIGTGKASSVGHYNLASWRSCDCAQVGGNWVCSNCSDPILYLVDKDGIPYQDTSPAVSPATATVPIWMPNGAGGTTVPALKLGALATDGTVTGEISGVTTGDFGGGTFAQKVVRRWVNNGPVPNTAWKCSMAPYFVDGNNNHQLDCEADDSAPTAASGDMAFDGTWEFNDMKMRMLPGTPPTPEYPALQSAVLMPRDNAYAFGDPVGAKKLMSTAFNGWFDGKHSLSTTTQLDAMQTLALVFLFFEGGEESWYSGMPGTGLPESNSSGKFRTMAPGMMEGGNVEFMNNNLGNAFIKWHQ